MTSLAHYITLLIDEQRDRLSSMRALIANDGDHASLRALAQTIASSDERIHSVAAVAAKLHGLATRRRDAGDAADAHAPRGDDA